MRRIPRGRVQLHLARVGSVPLRPSQPTISVHRAVAEPMAWLIRRSPVLSLLGRQGVADAEQPQLDRFEKKTQESDPKTRKRLPDTRLLTPTRRIHETLRLTGLPGGLLQSLRRGPAARRAGGADRCGQPRPGRRRPGDRGPRHLAEVLRLLKVEPAEKAKVPPATAEGRP